MARLRLARTVRARRGVSPAESGRLLLLLLLLVALLVVGEGARGGTALAGPTAAGRLGDAHELGLADRRPGAADGHANRQLAVRLALVDASRGRHVRVVAAHGAGDVP